MSVCQARRTIVAELQRVAVGRGRNATCLESPPSGVAFNTAELEFNAEPSILKKLFPPGNYRIDLKTLGEVSLRPDMYLLIGGKSDSYLRKHLSNASILGFVVWDWGRNEDGKAFASAMNSLRLYARAFDPSRDVPPACFADKDERARIWAEFQKRAAAWRALLAKPALSDEVRQQRLMAEKAFSEKRFEDAVAAYEEGLGINPLWPEGHFNAALIYAELKEYEDAAWHMRSYLELLPNAPDAQEAHGQTLLWRGEAKRQAAAPMK